MMTFSGNRQKGLNDIESRLRNLCLPADIREAVMILIARHADPIALMRSGDGQAAHYSTGAVARLFYNKALQRSQTLGIAACHDGTWLMLLDLFAATEEGRRIAVSSLCIASCKPSTTALRHVQELVDAGILLRKEDPNDQRRTFVELSDRAYETMRQVIHDFTIPRDLLVAD